MDEDLTFKRTGPPINPEAYASWLRAACPGVLGQGALGLQGAVP